MVSILYKISNLMAKVDGYIVNINMLTSVSTHNIVIVE